MEIDEILSWYYLVDKNIKPAKFLICKNIYVEVSEEEIKNLEEKELWKLHEKYSKEFKKILKDIKESKIEIKEFSQTSKKGCNFLELKIELSKRLLNPCRMCERRCLVNRFEKRGFCNLLNKTYVSSYFLHLGEETPLIPSGTIFFCGCNFKCAYCQNWEISQFSENGFIVDSKKLSIIERRLREEGARNINFVGGNPDQHLHTIVESLKFLDINVPILWNSNAYASIETMKILLDLVDIWLPDFKYGNNECAKRLSLVENYFEIVGRNIKMMYENEDPIIIRHLVLPNHIECCTNKVLTWISENCKNALVNVMKQYRPDYLVKNEIEKFREISRVLNKNEIEKAYKIASELKLNFEYIS
ncbi:MAG: radical SAM protein [Candidatus Aenigmatarchaeota archaeon]